MNITARVLLVLASAFAAWALWLGDVFWMNGARLSPFNWSSLPICLLIVAVASGVVRGRAATRNRLAFIASGFAMSLGAFVIARAALFQFFGITMGPMRVPNFGDVMLVMVISLALSGGLVALANRWLAPLSGWTFVLLALALALVLPLSLATTRFVSALNDSGGFLGTGDMRMIDLGYSDFWLVHAVRMGCAVFWTALLVPLALRLGQRRG